MRYALIFNGSLLSPGCVPGPRPPLARASVGHSPSGPPLRPAEAVELAPELAPQVVVMDVAMPLMVPRKPRDRRGSAGVPYHAGVPTGARAGIEFGPIITSYAASALNTN